jgi:hypothetical protein
METVFRQILKWMFIAALFTAIPSRNMPVWANWCTVKLWYTHTMKQYLVRKRKKFWIYHSMDKPQEILISRLSQEQHFTYNTVLFTWYMQNWQIYRGRSRLVVVSEWKRGMGRACLIVMVFWGYDRALELRNDDDYTSLQMYSILSCTL